MFTVCRFHTLLLDRGRLVSSCGVAAALTAGPTTWGEIDEVAQIQTGVTPVESHWTGSEYLVFVATGDPLRAGGNLLYRYEPAG